MQQSIFNAFDLSSWVIILARRQWWNRSAYFQVGANPGQLQSLELGPGGVYTDVKVGNYKEKDISSC